MTRNKPFTVALLALSAIAGAAAVQGIVVKYQPKVGETREYKVEGTIEAMGQAIELTGTSVEKTLKAEGDTYIEEVTQTVKINMGGNEQEAPPSTSTTTYKIGGLVVSSEGEQSNPRAERLAQFIEPSKEIKIGDTWSFEGKADEKTSSPAYKIEYKYLGDEKVGEWDSAKFSALAKETEGEKPMVYDSTIWISKADWSRVKSETKFQNMTNPMAPVTLDGKLSVLRTK